MSIEIQLRTKCEGGRKLLVPYVTGGMGVAWRDVVHACIAAGADAVEIGIPFSDPIVDGPTIQEASQRALVLGATPRSVIEEAADIDTQVPLVCMTYYNPVTHMGADTFAKLLVESGFSGIILPDVPLEELDPWEEIADPIGLETILLAAPNESDDRLGKICERTHGWVYAVSLMGVTGERQELSIFASDIARRLKSMTDKPVILGLGISSVDQAREAVQFADGVVVGSALMRILIEGGTAGDVGKFVGGLRNALDA